ncbi:RraA family protein [Planctomycetota bacterium]
MTSDERCEILDSYSTLRVADVRDGMDTFLMHGRGSMSPDVRPLWRTIACGIAKTARYVPYEGEIPKLDPDEYWKWVGTYYRDICSYPWAGEIQDGDFVVIDMSGLNVGLMGSNNTLDCVKLGARGFVTGGGVRDTDEIIIQKVPFWSTFIAQPMVQGRIAYDAHDIPVTVGGVEVHPGDVVVADGDGVIVVPRDRAMDVAEHARTVHRDDMEGRRKKYEALGMAPDETLEE